VAAHLSLATSTSVSIYAFSAPHVNGAEVEVSCNVGSLTVRGPLKLMRDFAAGLLKATQGKKKEEDRRRLPHDRGFACGSTKRVSPHVAKYRALIAEIDAHPKPLPFGFISRACRREGVARAAFSAWRNYQVKRTAPVAATERTEATA
jgi:hypothetical protein